MPDALLLRARGPLGTLDLDVALDVAAGTTLALVGPSGAGKTTTLAVAAGLLSPSTGRVDCGTTWLDTDRGIDLPPWRRRAGLVFQDYQLFPHLDVAGNVAFGARGKPVGRWLERLRLDGTRRVQDLSGGERQRVALARALAADPAVLLLDEPFGALDVVTRAHVRGEVQSLLRELPLPTVLVTHDPVDALVFGEAVAVLEDGRVAQHGSRDELRLRPRTPFAAQLTGLNLYRAEVPPGAGLKEARVGPGTLLHVLADDLSGTVFAAFGAAEVTVSAQPLPGSAQNSLQGRVTAVVPLPDRLRVIVDVGVPVAAEITHQAADALAIGPGREVWVTVKASAITVYA